MNKASIGAQKPPRIIELKNEKNVKYFTKYMKNKYEKKRVM